MSRRMDARAAIAAAALAAAAASVLYAQDKKSVWDGVYSDEQASRGKDEYEYNCGNCHIHDLSGDSIKDVPALAGPDFMAKWSGKSVKELLDYMATNMPQDSRGTLGAKTYADIAAYVLKMNMFPAGMDTLADSPRLAAAIIEREKGEKTK
ncbi:MAG TPA: cytochrome c [Vicinamibacterales bacterium]|jgi:mono/diheme cytochrome c family protein|nr:cytochrome c [Vicinamibacterales bacterium]